MHPKWKTIFGAILDFLLFQYWDSKTGLFSIAPYIVIALPIIATAIAKSKVEGRGNLTILKT